MMQLILMIAISFAALLAVNYAYGRLAGHVFADHLSAGRHPWFAQGLHLVISIALLMFGAATTVVWLLGLVRLEVFNELEGWIKLVILTFGQVGSVLAAVRGRRLAVSLRLSRPG